MSQGARQLALVCVTVIVVVIFLMLPKAPKTALEKQPVSDSVQVELEQAVQLVQQGTNPMEGILKIRQISEEHPDNIDAQLWLGVFSEQSGQMEKAISRFENVIALDTNNPVAHRYLGEFSMKDSLYDQAIRHFQTVYKEDSSYKSALFYIGKSHQELGNDEEALTYYERYLPFAPDSAVASGVNGFISELRNK